MSYILEKYDNYNKSIKEIIENLAIEHVDYTINNNKYLPTTLFHKLLSSESLDTAKKLELFSKLLPSLNMNGCITCFKEMKQGEFLKLFCRKQGKFEVNNINEYILQTFKTNNWIKDFQLNHSLNKFTAYGRNLLESLNDELDESQNIS